MIKITITIPKKEEKWKIGWGAGGPKKSKSRSELVVNALERRFFVRALKDKTVVKIKDGRMFINESVPSQNPKYLLWLLTAFLEDYLNRYFVLKKMKLYEGAEP